MRSETAIRVRYQETDKMGFAHHSAFFAWFEAGRSDLIRDAGRSYSEVEEAGIFLPVVDLHAKYHQPAYYDELLRLETWVEGFERVRIRFAYRLSRERGGQLVAEGETRHAVLGPENKPVRIPAWLKELLQK